MRNDKLVRIHRIYNLIKALPVFTIQDLSSIEQNKTYLKILLGRYVKTGKLIRLKRGLYTTRAYVDGMEKTQRLEAYKMILANLLYEPSYVSLEYMLFEYNLLTELPVQFTSISLRKTKRLQNVFGQFVYHSIKDELFYGFTKKMIGGFSVWQATKAKALFDFIYLRQHVLFAKGAITALRINTDLLTQQDKKEFVSFIKHSNSQRLHSISTHLIKI